MSVNPKDYESEIIRIKSSKAFKELERYYRKKSIFHILNISRKENRHSDFLCWLFSPKESHGLNDYALRRLLELLVIVKNEVEYDTDSSFLSGIEENVICGEYSISEIECAREHDTGGHGKLDLFISFNYRDDKEKGLKLYIILENKIYAEEGKKEDNKYQTDSYYDFGKVLSRDTSKVIYIYLEPRSNKELIERNGCKCEKFIGLNYQYLLDYVLEPCFDECTSLESRVFIEEYFRELGQPSLDVEDAKKRNSNFELVMAITSKEKNLLETVWNEHNEFLMILPGIKKNMMSQKGCDDENKSEEKEKLLLRFIKSNQDLLTVLFRARLDKEHDSDAMGNIKDFLMNDKASRIVDKSYEQFNELMKREYEKKIGRGTLNFWGAPRWWIMWEEGWKSLSSGPPYKTYDGFYFDLSWSEGKSKNKVISQLDEKDEVVIQAFLHNPVPKAEKKLGKDRLHRECIKVNFTNSEEAKSSIVRIVKTLKTGEFAKLAEKVNKIIMSGSDE